MIGYAFLSVSVTLAGYINLFTCLKTKEVIAGIVAAAGVIGKVITDLTKEKDGTQE
jgi:hypothetical protein